MSPPVRGPIDVLAILSGEQDQAQLANAPEKWRLRFVRSYEEAQAILRERTAKVIVTDYRIDDRHSWRDLLENRPSAIPPPLVIVVDRNADERMWIEVLTEGAVDLLSKPLNRAELYRVLSDACRRLREPMTMLATRAAA
jgi:FixJ family two-component response regulator